MFGDVNKVMLLGNITNDPDLRFTSGGTPVVSFGLATNRRYQKDGEWTDEVSFHNIVVWRSAESLAKRIRKGTRIFIEGRLHTRSWDDADGNKKYKTEITADLVRLIARYEGSRDEEDAAAGDNKGAKDTKKASGKSDKAAGDDVIDPDDLPF